MQNLSQQVYYLRRKGRGKFHKKGFYRGRWTTGSNSCGPFKIELRELPRPLGDFFPERHSMLLENLTLGVCNFFQLRMLNLFTRCRCKIFIHGYWCPVAAGLLIRYRWNLKLSLNGFPLFFFGSKFDWITKMNWKYFLSFDRFFLNTQTIWC